MRSSKGVLVLAAVLAIVGGLLFAFPGSRPELVVMQANSDASGDHVMAAEWFFPTARRILGIVLLLVASLLAAGLIGARRRT
jgi:hypothetical protein